MSIQRSVIGGLVCWLAIVFALALPYLATAQPTNLVDLITLSPDLVLDIRYATTHNFLQRRLYPVGRCLLRRSVAMRVAQVQADLQRRGLGLKVYDCYRPLSVQRQMWQAIPDSRYVASPARGSRHNRGAAIDVALVDRRGRDLEMPTDFDDFSERAGSMAEQVSSTARQHRTLLQQAMQRQGFTTIDSEWWHFDAPNWQRYGLLDVPLVDP